MSQVNTEMMPKCLTQLKTEEGGELKSREEFKSCWESYYETEGEVKVKLYRIGSASDVTLLTPEVAAKHIITAIWAYSCGISTHTIMNMKPPFPYKGQVEKTWNKISEASGDTLCKVVETCGCLPHSSLKKDNTVWELSVDSGVQGHKQKMWFKVEVTDDRQKKKHLASGIEMVVADKNGSRFRYGYRPDTQLFVEGVQRPTKERSTEILYIFNAKPDSQQWLWSRDGGNPTAEGSNDTSGRVSITIDL